MIDFSVARCGYGGDNSLFFDEALQSIISQTFLPKEIVLVVDGPVPDTIDRVIQKYLLGPIEMNVIRLAKNMGHGIARNTSIKACKYPYIAVADADDINVLNRFEIQSKYFEDNNKLSVVSSGCYHFSKSINEIINEESLPLSDSEIKKAMKTRCPICQASAMMKKRDVENAGGYIDWFYAEDYYLWLRMMLNGAVFANAKESLLYVRTDESQMLRRGGWKYFQSMRNLFKFMLNNNLISFSTYIFNVCSRFVLQVLLPCRLRAFVRKFAL